MRILWEAPYIAFRSVRPFKAKITGAFSGRRDAHDGRCRNVQIGGSFTLPQRQRIMFFVFFFFYNLSISDVRRISNDGGIGSGLSIDVRLVLPFRISALRIGEAKATLLVLCASVKRFAWQTPHDNCVLFKFCVPKETNHPRAFNKA